jgi:AraC family transcriptional regulator
LILSPPLELPGLRVSLKAFTPGQKLAWSRRVPGRLCVMLSGEMIETHRARRVRYRPTDLVYKAPEERPLLAFGGRHVRTLTVELEPGRLAALGEAGRLLQRSFSRHGASAAAALAARISAELRSGDELSPLVVEGLVFELLAEACRLTRPGRDHRAPGWLRQVSERVDAEFTRRLTLTDCALEVGVHPVHLAQRFRAQYRESFGRRIRRLRIDLSARLLAETAKPIAEIALDAGFSDQSHLTKAFKRARGLTPAAFRRSLRRA